MKEHWKIFAFTFLTFLQLAQNLSSLNDELNPSLKLLSIGGIGLLVLSLLNSLFQLITSVSAKFQLSRENFKIGACVWLFVNVCAALWSFIHSSFLTMLALRSETTTAEILLEAKRVETETGGEEEITAIEEAEILAPEDDAPAAPFLISWLFTLIFVALVWLIALELVKKAKQEDEIYAENNTQKSKTPEPENPVPEKKISSDSNDIGYWSDSTPGISSNTSIAEKVAAPSSSQFDQSDNAASTRQYTEIEGAA